MAQIAGEIRRISQCNVNAQLISKESRQVHYLTPWDLKLLSTEYIQMGLLFAKPHGSTATLLAHLKDSLSRTLNHFPSLVGTLATKISGNPPSSILYLDCTNPPGVEFIHAVTTLSVSDMFSPKKDVPETESFFPLKNAVSHDAHTKPALSVQVTELVDAIFLALKITHSVVDGTSFWHFINTWAEISRENTDSISRPPVTKRLFVDPENQIINLPNSHPDEFVVRFRAPPLRVRMFHFSAKSIAGLKAKANAEAKTSKISSFQALIACVWRSMTRARNLAVDQETRCSLAINDHSRLRPAESPDYFGTCISLVDASATASELLDNNLGWSAWLLHLSVINHADAKLRSWWDDWVKNPEILDFHQFAVVPSMLVQNSPRFDVYGNDFGWGKPLCVRSGQGKTCDGNVVAYPGREEEGSVELELCLSPESMTSLLLDKDFMGEVTP